MRDGAMSLLLATAVNDHKFIFARFVSIVNFHRRMRFSGLFMLTDHFNFFFMVALMLRYTIDFHPNKSFQLQRKTDDITNSYRYINVEPMTMKKKHCGAALNCWKMFVTLWLVEKKHIETSDRMNV